jgi:predicted RNA binding protein YcfA (HicA-like mRNA interferase family)
MKHLDSHLNFYRLLIKYGCIPIGIKGSHHKVMNPMTSKVSVITIHAGKDFDKGAFISVLMQLGIDIQSFINFMQA